MEKQNRTVQKDTTPQEIQAETSAISGVKKIKKAVKGICESAGVMEVNNSIKSRTPVSLEKVGISVMVTNNIDINGKDNNIEVKLIWKTEDGYEDYRILEINGVCENEEYVRQALLNMGFLDKNGEVAEVVMNVVKEKIQNRRYILQYFKIGWGMYKGKPIFKLFRIHNAAGAGESEYVGKLKINKKGDLDGYVNGLKKLVVGKPKLELALIVGVYGILLQLLELPDCNLIINFYGKSTNTNYNDTSGIGKSTAVKLCLMLYGYAYELFKTYNATDNKIEAEMAKHVVVPYVIDDKLVTSIGTSKRRLVSELVKFVFRFVSGQVRGRLNDSKYESYEKIYSPTIITAESAIADKMIGVDASGQFSRVIEIPCSRGELTGSKEHCEQLEEFISSYAGIGGEAFIEFLFREGLLAQILKEKYEAWVKMINAGVLGRSYIGSRVANKVSIIMLSAELLNQCFGLDMELSKIQETLENSVQDVNEKAKFADRAYEHLCNYVKNNFKRFAGECSECIRSNDDNPNAYIGHYKNIKGQWQVWLLGEGFEEVFKEFKEVKNLETIVESWKNSGIIISGREKEKRNTSKRTFYKDEAQKNVYIIKVPDLEI